jgi:hypothetical protein
MARQPLLRALLTDQFLSWLSLFFCLISCHLLLCGANEVAGLFEQARESLCMCVLQYRRLPGPTSEPSFTIQIWSIWRR